MTKVLSQLEGPACGPVPVGAASLRSARVERTTHDVDRELMVAVAAGDEAAQLQLARRISPRVLARARSLTASAADAEDAAQVALLEILRSASGYRGEGSLEAWSERITMRVVLRSHRRRARWLALVDPRADPDHVAQPPPSRGLDDVPFELERFLDELSDERREVLTLRAGGHGIDEIAAALRLSPNTVKDRLRTARLELRRRIRQAESLASARTGRSRGRSLG